MDANIHETVLGRVACAWQAVVTVRPGGAFVEVAKVVDGVEVEAVTLFCHESRAQLAAELARAARELAGDLPATRPGGMWACPRCSATVTDITLCRDCHHEIGTDCRCAVEVEGTEELSCDECASMKDVR